MTLCVDSDNECDNSDFQLNEFEKKIIKLELEVELEKNKNNILVNTIHNLKISDYKINQILDKLDKSNNNTDQNNTDQNNINLNNFNNELLYIKQLFKKLFSEVSNNKKISLEFNKLKEVNFDLLNELDNIKKENIILKSSLKKAENVRSEINNYIINGFL